MVETLLLQLLKSGSQSAKLNNPQADPPTLGLTIRPKRWHTIFPILLPPPLLRVQYLRRDGARGMLLPTLNRSYPHSIATLKDSSRKACSAIKPCFPKLRLLGRALLRGAHPLVKSPRAVCTPLGRSRLRLSVLVLNAPKRKLGDALR